jgi:chromosome transmission fidelity protein 1
MNLFIAYEISTDGRVTFKLSKPPGQENVVEMTYHLLNPSLPFRDIVDEARSVVLAGGTMSPVGAISLP